MHINGLNDAGFCQSMSSDTVLRPPVPQVVDVSGSESPSLMNWNARNHCARHDISRARLCAIESESSLEKGQVWVPPPAHRLGKKKLRLNRHCSIIFFSENLRTLSVTFCWIACKELRFKQATLL